MRAERANEPLIGVSCGHRVPRRPLREGGRKLYWCGACKAWRMSGTRSTGEHGHAELQAIAELVGALEEPVEIRLAREPLEHQRKLIEALGGRVVIAPRAPSRCEHAG